MKAKRESKELVVAVKLSCSLWKEIKLRAVTEGTTMRRMVEDSLRLYLKTPSSRRRKKRGTR